MNWSRSATLVASVTVAMPLVMALVPVFTPANLRLMSTAAAAPAPGMSAPVDTDGDGIIDSVDLDDDNDTISDDNESTGDTDLDGIPDYLDQDSDNDGLTDLMEAQVDLRTLYALNDLDYDGIMDSDVEVGANGLADLTETTPDSGLGTTGYLDTDGDGVLDHLDRDSDNDGLADLEESGIPDLIRDAMVDQPLDANQDGLDDNVISRPGYGFWDLDLDGIPNFRDTDSDGDERSDALEASGTDQDNDGLIDDWQDLNMDGLYDGYESANPNLIDTDCDRLPDIFDLDGNGDGIADIQQELSASSQPVDPQQSACSITAAELQREFYQTLEGSSSAAGNGQQGGNPVNDDELSDDPATTGIKGSVLGGCSLGTGDAEGRGTTLWLLSLWALGGLVGRCCHRRVRQ